MTRTPHAALTVLCALVVAGCTRFSIRELDPSAGFNGGFETVKAGLPVNWYFYYPPLKAGDATIVLDSTDKVEGRQALELVVRRTNGPGWGSAGFFQVVPAESRRAYRVSFSLKHDGCQARISIYSEKPTEASSPAIETLSDRDAEPNVWRRFEYVYTVPDTYANIRFQVGVVEPGTLWVDDVRIDAMPAPSARVRTSTRR